MRVERQIAHRCDTHFILRNNDYAGYLRPGKLFIIHESLPVNTVGLLNKDALQQARTAVVEMIKGS